MMLVRKYFLLILLLFVSILFLYCFYSLTRIPYLSFSDSAKYADIARNVSEKQKYESNFSFFGSPALGVEINPVSRWVPPFMPLTIAVFFRLFGISDLSPVLASSLFYVCLVILIFLLGKKLWGSLVGFLAALSIAFNVNFLEYASSGASEILFSLEIILAIYLMVLKNKVFKFFSFLVLILMYLTRAQAIIYIIGLIFLYLLLNLPIKKALSYTFGIFVLGSSLYLAISRQGLFALTQHLPGIAASDALRGGVQEMTLVGLFKKTFYNLYNFYKLLPQIASPYMWGLFIIGLFHWGKNRVENSFKIATIFMVVVTFIVTATTIPFFRYIHPVIPLVYIFATATLVWVIQQIVKIDWKLEIGNWKFRLQKAWAIALISALLIVYFAIGQTLGVIFLDSRFKAKTVNKGKPPVYVQLSWKLKEVTKPEDVIITNLDTWGSWYGERKTVWFPLKPGQLDLGEGKVFFDAIYLTSYLMDDENYYMGDEWRQIFTNPENPENKFIKENYILKGVYEIPANETYERQAARAVLLIRK